MAIRKKTACQPIPDLVPHPRFGCEPRASGMDVLEDVIRASYWRYDKVLLFPKTVLVADTAKQNYSIYPRKYYVDILRLCRECTRPFIFFAREQRYWYETLGFYIDADCVVCPACRRDDQLLRQRLHRYSDLLHKTDQTRKEMMFLVDDGVYLLAHGVLRNLHHLGRLKNRALALIPEYPATQKLKASLLIAHQKGKVR